MHNILDDEIKDEFDYEIIDFKREEVEVSKLSQFYYPDNSCSKCKNEYYLDLNALLFEDKTRFWSDIEWGYEKIENNFYWRIVSVVKIPIFEDNKKIVTFKNIKLSTYTVHKNGMQFYEEHHNTFFKKSVKKDKEFYRVDKVFKDSIYSIMPKFMITYPSESIAWLTREVNTMEELSFFLKHPNLRSRDIFFWQEKEYFLEHYNEYQNVIEFLDFFLNHRQEKSLRKAQFLFYRKMMNSTGYNPMVDYIFSRTINDRNYLLKVLKIDTQIKQNLFKNCNIENINYFIVFLKNNYQEKYIVQFWLSISSNDLEHFLLRDTIQLFSTDMMRTHLSQNFKKTALNLRAIHHELIKHGSNFERLKQDIKTFSYSDILLSTQGVKENIEYRLPFNNEVLYEWGTLLHNCIFSYSQSLLNGTSTIFGLFIDGRLTYAIEIKNHKIVQASASHNKTLNLLERRKIDQWYKSIYLFKINKYFNNFI